MMSNFVYRIPCRLAHVGCVVDLGSLVGSLVWIVGWIVGFSLTGEAGGKNVGSSKKESTARHRPYIDCFSEALVAL